MRLLCLTHINCFDFGAPALYLKTEIECHYALELQNTEHGKIGDFRPNIEIVDKNNYAH